MKIIVPMAGIGKRMRPFTFTTPKPLIPIAGKPIVQLLIEEIASVVKEDIEEIAFIVGHFGEEVENRLLEIAKSFGAKGKICYQEEALGTAHAIYCAKETLEGRVLIAYADTLFKANFNLDETADSVIFVKTVDNPSAFGVVKVDENNKITDFIEKPKDNISNKAIIGIYYFKEGKQLKNEIEYLIKNNITVGGEYQLTTALENLKNKNLLIKPGKVYEWLDCGNKNATVYTNSKILEFEKDKKLIDDSVKNDNSIIISPSYIGKDVILKNCIIGPFVSIGEGCNVTNTIIKNSIVLSNVNIENSILNNSLIGNYSQVKSSSKELALGDYSTEL
ncbi:MAG: sugar phosphate nucleotidyltransferase [Bacteroidota bacterium]|nr:sugar phosphate nucleotidyltransferase [Bacteroidota bacterium]